MTAEALSDDESDDEDIQEAWLDRVGGECAGACGVREQSGAVRPCVRSRSTPAGKRRESSTEASPMAKRRPALSDDEDEEKDDVLEDAESEEAAEVSSARQDRAACILCLGRTASSACCPSPLAAFPTQAPRASARQEG